MFTFLWWDYFFFGVGGGAAWGNRDFLGWFLLWMLGRTSRVVIWMGWRHSL